jgi:hypothetical protein
MEDDAFSGPLSFSHVEKPPPSSVAGAESTQARAAPDAGPAEAGELALQLLARVAPPAEPVLLGTSCPSNVRPGDEFTARFVACVERLEAQVSARLERMDAGAVTAIRFRRCQWQLGTKVRVRCSSNQLSVSPAEQELIWDASESVLDFGVQVPPGARQGRTAVQFEVFIAEVRVALLRHDLVIAKAPEPDPSRRPQLSRAPQTAFASYASEDRPRVLDRVASMRIHAGLDVFMDCLSLRPGDEWKNVLRTEIEQRDLFLLFWSRHAGESEWVEWEWRTALSLKQLAGIQPHPLEPSTSTRLPEELAALQLADPVMWARREPGEGGKP